MAKTQAERSAAYRVGLKRAVDEIKAIQLAQGDWAVTLDLAVTDLQKRMEAIEARLTA